MYDTMAVGVADCFADLAQQVELGGEWDALRMVCEPEVEAAELGLDQISRPQDAVVVEGLDSAELVLADLPASALAEHDRIDLMPLALFITEFEICPDRNSG